MVRQGMRVVRVPAGAGNFKRDFLQEVVSGEPGELVRALVSRWDAQASFHVVRLSVVSRVSHLLCMVPPSITHQAVAGYEAFVQ